MSYFFFFRGGKHNFTFWFPTQRVLNEIADSTVYSDNALCWMECQKIDSKSIVKILDDGEVNFEESKVREVEEKIYCIEGESISGKAIRFKARMFPKYAEIFSVELKEGKADCPNCN